MVGEVSGMTGDQLAAGRAMTNIMAQGYKAITTDGVSLFTLPSGSPENYAYNKTSGTQGFMSSTNYTPGMNVSQSVSPLPR